MTVARLAERAELRRPLATPTVSPRDVSQPIKLIASLVVRNELSRYLEQCVGSLLEFCDEIRVLDDLSGDDSLSYLTQPNVWTARNGTSRFYEHEGYTRQKLLEWTLVGEPTHVLNIDADELVSDGPALRRRLERDRNQIVWSLCMEEVWQADTDGYQVRCDGGWCPNPVKNVWRVPASLDASWRIADRQLACGREPMAVRNYTRPTHIDVSILHLGWTNVSERQARYDRYVKHDGGRFHQRAHLDSIMWDDERVRLEGRSVPPALTGVWPAVVERANR